ncbi:MAG: alpha/beta fold hydrolase [Solirubrobacteraceae bacterium]
MTETTLLLIHGAWHGAWCWEPVIERLEANGIGAEALDLPGHGDSAAPPTDLHGHAEAVRQALERTRGRVVLVGHSYGGAVITQVGEHPAIEQLVYLAAMVPDVGESAMALLNGEGELAPNEAMRTAVKLEDESLVVDPALAAEFFFGSADADVVRQSIERLCPQSIASFAQPVTNVAWRAHPATYIVCQEDQALPVAAQRRLAERTQRVYELASDHSPFLSCPDRLTELLCEIASTTPAP